MNNKEQRLIALPSANGAGALSLGTVGHLQPVIVLEAGQTESEAPSSPKLQRSFTIPPRKKVSTRLVHAALGDVNLSVISRKSG